MFLNNNISKRVAYSNFGKEIPQEQKKENKTNAPLNNSPQEQDIFTTMPFRLLGYTNEVGEAIKGVVPSARLGSWIVASMYMGADIYDKYKKGDEESNYKPSIKKGVCEAIFQGLASCTLTIAAVEMGKEVVSHAGKSMSKSGLSLEAQKELLGFVGKKVREGALDTPDGVKTTILAPIKSMMTETKDMKPPSLFNPMARKNYQEICTIAGENMKHTAKMDPKKVEQFVNNTINETSHLQKGLQTGTLAGDAPVELNKIFGKTKQACAATMNHYKHEPNAKTKAINETLQKHLDKQSFSRNIMMAAGGLAALLLCSKLIDKGVEKYIIEPLEHKWTQKEREKKTQQTNANKASQN